MTPKPKEIKKGAYAKDAVEFEPSQKKTVVPYEEIVKSLKEGNIFVMPLTSSKNTVAQALKRIRDVEKHNVPNAKVGKTKETAQFVFYVD